MPPGIALSTALCIESQTTLEPILREVLRRVGFKQITFTSDLHAAQRHLEQKTFGATLVDIHAAHDDRPSLVEFMKMKFAAEVPVRVLMVTSMGWDITHFVDQLEIDRLVRKPFTPAQLASALSQKYRAGSKAVRAAGREPVEEMQDTPPADAADVIYL